MNTLIIFESDRLKDDLFEISDPKRLCHLEHVLGAQVGQSLRVGLLDDRFGVAKVLKLNPFQIEVKWQSSPDILATDIRLSIGLSRPPTLKKILEHATSLGVGHFQFYKARLSEKSYADSKIFEDANMRELLLAGLSQSSHSLTLPKVEVTKLGTHSLKPIEQSFVLSLRESKSLFEYDIDYTRPLHFLLGPERGLTGDEESDLISRGFRPVKIHPSILRVEIATFALLGAVEVLRANALQSSLKIPPLS